MKPSLLQVSHNLQRPRVKREARVQRSQLSGNPSARSLSVTKHQSFPRHQTSSVEPHLPALKSRSPEPHPRGFAAYANSSFAYEADLQKLETLIDRNETARNGLLQVQARIVEIGVSKAIRRQPLDSILEEGQFSERFKGTKAFKLPPIYV